MVKKKGSNYSSGVTKSQIDLWFARATFAMQAEDWEVVIEICARLLRYLPKKSADRADALSYMANAYGMLQKFELAYQALCEALIITPNDSVLWFNRGLTDRFLTLIGQSVRDLEKAISLLQNPETLPMYKEELLTSEKMAQVEISLRYKGFTLDQLIEQQEYFHQGNALMMQRNWLDAEKTFRNAIQMCDCLPNPQGNLGVCLLMQKRFDEAEAALKRALKIDKKYKIAKQNLLILEKVKKGAPLPDFKMNEPFKGKIKVSSTYINE